jgi:O-antigen ligase
MLKAPEKRFLERLLLAAAALATVAITPKTTADPINVIKMSVIAILGFSGAGLLILNFKKLYKKGNKLVFNISGLFILFLLLGIVTSGKNFNQEFFGTYGRNSGFVTYISLLILMLCASVVSAENFVRKFIFTFIAVGFLSTVYGYLQHVGIEPAGWVSPYNPILGFMGNPDFMGAFLGLTIIAALGPILSPGVDAKYRGLCIGYVLVALYLIRLMGVKQGFLVAIIGISVVFVVRIFFSKLRVLYYLAVGVGLFVGGLVFLALFNVGPLASLLYKSSLTARGYYWQAAIKMIQENPILGVGLDSYGDWYRRARSLEAYNWLPTQYSDSAHNVYLDMAAGGGIPLLLVYLSLMGLVVVIAIKELKALQNFDPFFASLLAIWVSFSAQLLISINQIGVAVWGWIATGLIIGYHNRNREMTEGLNSIQPKVKKIKGYKSNLREATLRSEAVVSITIGLTLGCLMGLPTYIGAARYFTALSSGEVQSIERAAYFWPKNERHFLQVAITLRDNKQNTISANPKIDPISIPDYSNLGLGVARDAVKYFPDSISAWQLLRSFPGITAQEDELSKRKIARLDPIAHSK